MTNRAPQPPPGADDEVTVTGDFVVTMAELRLVTAYVVTAATALLPRFEAVRPGDDRPRLAVEAGRVFAEGAPRTRLQRTTSVGAHRAARAAAPEGLADLLRRYPPPPVGRSRPRVLLHALDAALRSP